MNHKERDFEQVLEENAPLFKMKYVKIPDALPLDKDGKVLKRGERLHISHKLPCDGILATERGNYFIECKYQCGVLKPHQKELQDKITRINNTYYVLRKQLRKTKQCNLYFYVIEVNGIKIYKTQHIENLFKFFTDPREHQSQEIMKGLDELIPEKKRKRLRKVLG